MIFQHLKGIGRYIPFDNLKSVMSAETSNDIYALYRQINPNILELHTHLIKTILTEVDND